MQANDEEMNVIREDLQTRTARMHQLKMSLDRRAVSMASLGLAV